MEPIVGKPHASNALESKSTPHATDTRRTCDVNLVDRPVPEIEQFRTGGTQDARTRPGREHARHAEGRKVRHPAAWTDSVRATYDGMHPPILDTSCDRRARNSGGAKRRRVHHRVGRCRELDDLPVDVASAAHVHNAASAPRTTYAQIVPTVSRIRHERVAGRIPATRVLQRRPNHFGTLRTYGDDDPCQSGSRRNTAARRGTAAPQGTAALRAATGTTSPQARERYSITSGQPSKPNFSRIWFSRKKP